MSIDNQGTTKRGPGRPPKAETAQRGETDAGMAPSVANANAGVVSGDRESKAHGITRFNRQKLGGPSQTLSLPPHILEKLKAEDKHIAFIRDDSRGRLQQVKNAGYEHVVDDHGNNIFRDSGPMKLYLMAVPNDWHEDDKALLRKKSAAILGREAAIGAGEYSPTDPKGTSAVSTSERDVPN